MSQLRSISSPHSLSYDNYLYCSSPFYGPMLKDMTDSEWAEQLKLLAESTTYDKTFFETCDNQTNEKEFPLQLKDIELFRKEEDDTFFMLEDQPEPFQRKSYPHNKRKEKRCFKPAVLRVVPKKQLQHKIQIGTAIMRIVDENSKPVPEHEPQISELDPNTKAFAFFPIALGTSKGQFCRLQFTINFLLEDGEQKSQVIKSSKFRIVSRITPKHKREYEEQATWSVIKNSTM